MSADERALLVAVAADPDADLPRLVYADFLEETGRPERAEFIRLQCEWHRAVTDPAREPFRNHIYNRLQDHGLAHGDGCPPDFGGAVAWADCRRGLPTTATVVADDMTAPWADVFLAAPLTRVEVHNIDGDQMKQLVEVPPELTAGLRRLELATLAGSSGLIARLRHRFGDRLRNPNFTGRWGGGRLA